MKLTFYIFLLGSVLQATCAGELDHPNKGKTGLPVETYSTVSVGGDHLTLANLEGKCALFITGKDSNMERLLTLEIPAPCEFVRKTADATKPLVYSYGIGEERRDVLIIAGGPRDKEFPDVKDAFRPDGCGSQFQKVRVFAERIELGSWEMNAGPVCASHGLDEKFFATP